MKKIVLLIVLAMALLLSCSSTGGNEEAAADPNQTPEALIDDAPLNGREYLSSKEYRGDIVNRLYLEAMEKDDKLKSLNDRIEAIRQMSNDSLLESRDYLSVNQEYWSTTARYTSQLNDTTLRDGLSEMTEKLAEKYQARIAPLKDIHDKIDSNSLVLQDHHILMKLLVTQPMITNFQRNEFPSLEKTQEVNDAYEGLIKDMEPYTTISK